MAEIDKDLPIDTKLLSDAVIELNIARRSVATYPKGHPLISATINKAFDILSKLFAMRDEMTLGIAKDTLIVGQDYLDKKNQVYRDFALSLYKKGIASVTFIKGLEKDELFRFHSILSSELEAIGAMGGIEKAIEKEGIRHIKVMPVDYRAFRLTEEEKVTATKKSDLKKDSMWETFVYGLVGGELDFADEQAKRKYGDIDPVFLAKILNKKSSEEIPEEAYDRTIANFLREAEEGDRVEKSNVSRLTDFISNLRPNLKSQFLSGTFKYLSARPKIAEDVLSKFSSELVLDALQGISERDMHIPPVVLNLLQKLSTIGQREQSPQVGGSTLREEKTPEQGIMDEEKVRERVMAIFKEDDIGRFVPKGYQDTISKVITTTPASGADSVMEDLLGSVSEASIEEHVVKVVFEILEGDITDEEFSVLVRKLKEMSSFFLSTGQFNILAGIHNALTSRLKSVDKSRMETIMDAIGFFSGKEFMEEVIDGFRLWGREKFADMSVLIRKVGSGFIPLLFDILAAEENRLNRKLLIELLSTFGSAVTPEALSRVNDSRWFFVRNLIIIMRQSEDRTSLPAIQKLVDHPHPKVQIEALKALLQFNAPDSVAALKKAILSKDTELSMPAIALSGIYKVSDVMDVLLQILGKRAVSEADYVKKEACVKALGDFGDSRAMPELERLYRSRSLFAAGAVKRLKEAIIQSMDKYPPDSAKRFLEAAISRKDEMEKLCRDMLNRVARKAVLQDG
ncbi:MAG: HEAT repeat domain-containing protein [Nitrospirae bacterium]|nr:HEAT repeat domain-containing protein [Nitrospirota bacterium]